MSKRKKPKRLKITVKPSTYNPTKAELEEEVHLDATPEQIAKMMQRVDVVHEK